MDIVSPEAASAPMPPAADDQRTHSATTSKALTNAAAEVRGNPGAVTPVRAKALGIVTSTARKTGDPAVIAAADQLDDALASATTLLALKRAKFPRVVIEEIEFPEGSYILQREYPKQNLFRIGWDPAQTTRAKVEIWINIYVAATGEYVEYTPAVYQALGLLHQWRQAGNLGSDDPCVIEFWDTMEQAVIASNDPIAAVAIISEGISAAFAEKQLAEVERIAASLGAQVVEVDPAKKPASLNGTTVYGWYDAEPTPRLIFPADAKPGERLHAAREIHRDLVSQ